MAFTSNTPESEDEPYQRSHVVIASQDSGPARPFLILSDESFPNYGQEYLVVQLGTAQSPEAIEIPPREWEIGGRTETIYAYPSSISTLPHEKISTGFGAISSDLANKIGEVAANYFHD